MDARIRARAAPRDRAADGTDQLATCASRCGCSSKPWRRRSPIASATGSPTRCEAQLVRAPHHLLFRQFRLQAPRSLDELIPANLVGRGGARLCARYPSSLPEPNAHRWVSLASLAPPILRFDHRPLETSTSTSARLREAARQTRSTEKNSCFRHGAPESRRGSRQGCRPGSVAANQTPIISESRRAGASLEISASPTGARWSSPTVARKK